MTDPRRNPFHHGSGNFVGHLAKELERFMQTGKEDDELYGATKKK